VIVRYLPTADVRAWFELNRFAPCQDDDSWTRTYAHSSGVGTVTARFWPHHRGWDLIVSVTDQAVRERSVSLGTCRSLADMGLAWDVLSRFDVGMHRNRLGEPLDPVQPLAVREVTA
jgi:hypothetical protein